MAKPEWGAKRICHNCGARYYDMRRDPIICPKCGTEFDPEAFLKSRRSRAAVVEDIKPAKAKRKAAAVDEVAEDEVEDQEDDDLDQEDEAADELVEDDSDDDADEPEGDGKPKKKKKKVDDDIEDDSDDGDVLLEDASELGDDDDVEDVVDLEDDEER